MTNEEMIYELQRTDDGVSAIKYQIALDFAINSIKENTKLKAEIEQLNAMLKAKDAKQDFNTYCELRKQNEELISETIKLKSELERYKKLIPKMCENCEYEDLLGYEEPCERCFLYSKWKLKCEVSND